MSRRIRRPAVLSSTASVLAIAVALGSVMPIERAEAQIARGDSVLRRVGKDYGADGIQLGGFLLTPRIEVRGEYDDNVYRTKHDRKDDFSFHFTPSIALATDGWDTVNFSIGASADIGRYVQYTGENYEAFQTNADLSYAIDDDWSWNVGGSVAHNRLRRGLDTDDSSNKASTYWGYTAQTSLNYQGDPFAFRFSPVYRRYDFNDSGGINNDDRDRQEFELGGRFAYKVGANTSIFFDPTYTWYRYDQGMDSFGHNRNSQGYDVRVGVGYDVSELLYVEAGIGYFHRSFQDSFFKASSGVSALARFYWNPTDTLSFEGALSRGVTESDAFINATTVNSGTAINTGVELRGGWLAADNILVEAGGGWHNFNYNVLSRKDNFYTADIGIRYFLNRNLYTGARYSYERRSSNDHSLDYNDNRVMITIGGQL